MMKCEGSSCGLFHSCTIFLNTRQKTMKYLTLDQNSNWIHFNTGHSHYYKTKTAIIANLSLYGNKEFKAPY
jgi:hypothetical protein